MHDSASRDPSVIGDPLADYLDRGMDDRTTGERIRALRKARGWNQQRLAELAGTRVMTISRWERDEVDRYDPAIMAGLATALEVDESWLRYGDGGDVALTASGWREWVQGSEAEGLAAEEKDALLGMGQAATAAGYRLTPGVYSAWRVALRMYGHPPTTR